MKRTQTASFTHGIAVPNEAHSRDGRRMNALSITAEQTEEQHRDAKPSGRFFVWKLCIIRRLSRSIV